MGNHTAYLSGLCVLASSIAASGGAAATGIETVWTCWYDGSASVLCSLLTAPPPMDETSAESAVPWLVPTSERIRRPLPAIVHVISQDPAQFASRTVRIPLHNYAHNMDAVEQLADAVMCGGRDDCRVQFERG
ncbi:hypothetical protein AZOA_08860 [Azoarcus sp. Aa7]|nr:hypothetical protein [Azoarcus sp. Aa7]